MTPATFEKETEIRQAPTNGSVPGVYRAIVGVSADIAKDGIAKDSRNVQQGYAFRGIDAVMNALAPLLVKHQLVILPRMLSRDVVERQAKSGGSLFYVTVEMEFDFVCAVDGSVHTVRMFGEAMDSADKATNKAASASYKYAAFQAFCIPTEGDNDPDGTTHELAAPAPLPPAILPAREERENTVAAPVGERAASSDRPSPPAGFVYLDDYKHSDNGFHDMRVGRTKYSTKDAVGRIAGEAFAAGRPVKITSSPKRNSPGEHWLNGVIVWTGENRSGSDASL